MRYLKYHGKHQDKFERLTKITPRLLDDNGEYIKTGSEVLENLRTLIYIYTAIFNGIKDNVEIVIEIHPKEMEFLRDQLYFFAYIKKLDDYSYFMSQLISHLFLQERGLPSHIDETTMMAIDNILDILLPMHVE